MNVGPNLGGETPEEDSKSKLPDDILFDIILSRLPVKTLCKLRCVSKQWCTQISDPSFLKKHRNHSEKNPILLVVSRILKICTTQLQLSGRDVDFNVFIDDSISMMLPSRWDIICFQGRNMFHFCNPNTQEFKSFPVWKKTILTTAFGYISASNEYVLVALDTMKITYPRSPPQMECGILKLSDGGLGKWRILKACHYTMHSPGVFVDNVFYWLRRWYFLSTEVEHNYLGREAIVSFDLETEAFGTLSPPLGCLDLEGLACSLLDINGFLCLVDVATRPPFIDIWMMKDCKRQVWVKEYIIDFTGFNLAFWRCPLEHCQGDIFIVAEEGYFCYDIKRKSFNRVKKEWPWRRLYIDGFFSLGSRSTRNE